ncbi:MAG: hypothetical protein KAH10_00110 [Flavobacteriales bacterium]|nr:hypothetical protein [Flavobacteriales bacterium]
MAINRCPNCNSKQKISKVIFQRTRSAWACDNCGSKIEHDTTGRYFSIGIISALGILAVYLDNNFIHNYWAVRIVWVLVSVLIFSQNKLILSKRD